MNKIHFNNQSNWKNSIMLILAIISFILGGFEITTIIPGSWRTSFIAAGIFSLLLYFANELFWKYYFGWNKTGATIKIKSLVGKSFKFRNVKSFQIKDQKLTIILRKGNEMGFDLTDINENDIKQLRDILQSNISAIK